MNPGDFEICSECGYQIPLMEQAYVFNGSIVCQNCDQMLRKELIIMEEPSNYSNQEKSKSDTSLIENFTDFEDSSSQVPDDLPQIDSAELNAFVNTKFDNSSNISASASSTALQEQIEIKLPSFLHSYYTEKKLSPANSSSKKSHKTLGGLAAPLVIAGIVLLVVVLLLKFLY